MSNPLRNPDPTDQFPPSSIIDESRTGTRHPGRFEPRTASIPNTQLVRNDTARVYLNSALSVVNGGTIVWDSKSFDSTGIWNGATGFVVPATGKITGPWKVKAQIVWPGIGAGTVRQIEIQRNAVAVTRKAGSATSTYMDIEDDFYDVSRNDLFTIVTVHDAGGSLALTVGSDKCFFSMVHTG